MALAPVVNGHACCHCCCHHSDCRPSPCQACSARTAPTRSGGPRARLVWSWARSSVPDHLSITVPQEVAPKLRLLPSLRAWVRGECFSPRSLVLFSLHLRPRFVSIPALRSHATPRRQQWPHSSPWHSCWSAHRRLRRPGTTQHRPGEVYELVTSGRIHPQVAAACAEGTDG